MARKKVIYVISLNARKASLDWSLEAAFANYTRFYQLQIFFKVQVHFTRLETELSLDKDVICECDVVTNTMMISFVLL